MDSYLTETKEKLKSKLFGNLHLIIGNESCDLDSAVCALVYGAFLHWQHSKIKCQVCTRSSRDEASYHDDIFVPILNVDREDFQLKTEVVYLLRQQGINEDMLIFRNDLDWELLCTKPGSTSCLVDHHALARRDRFLAPLVSEIIDHRHRNDFDWELLCTKPGSTACLVDHHALARRDRFLAPLVSEIIDHRHRNDFDWELLCTKPGSTACLVDHHALARRDRFLAPLVSEIIDHRYRARVQCRNDFDWELLCTKPGSTACLVDHHALARRDRFLAPLVSEIIDHRHRARVQCRNDFDWELLCTKPGSTACLVDHHALARRDRFLAPLVSEIIDHRPLDRTNWDYHADTRSSIEVVGSCCSLVTQRIRSLSKLLAKEQDFFTAVPVAADMLLCGIILDTVNFSKELNKTTPVDVESATFLESILKPASVDESRLQRLECLVAARKDVSELTPEQILRKDTKIVGDILVPSLPILVEEWLQSPQSTAAALLALKRSGCGGGVLLGMCLRGGLSRDVAVFAGVDRRRWQDMLAQHLQQWKTPDLQLVSAEVPNKTEFIYFKQQNLSASRKQFIPAITKFLEDHNDTKEV